MPDRPVCSVIGGGYNVEALLEAVLYLNENPLI